MKHNMAHSRIYHIYQGVKQRCLNPKNPSYYLYGGRGISICAEWVDNFQAFYGWSMENGYTDEMTLDRIDSEKDYSPQNCQWISKSANSVRVQDRNGTPETIAARKELKAKGKIGKTSSKVKQKYNDRVYQQISVRLQKELVENWETEIENDGISKAAFIREAIVEYLNQKQGG